jgi:16S rRNA (guanine527-N7)-methyltransferase
MGDASDGRRRHRGGRKKATFAAGICARTAPAETARGRLAEGPGFAAAKQELLRGAGQFGIVLSEDAVRRFAAYVDTLLLWSTRIALTGAGTAPQIVRDHIVDSLAVVQFVRPGARVADLGSGAGFPGIPLAITCPQAHCVLVESRRKKANFLREVARVAGLANVEVREARAEDPGEGMAGTLDVVVSRAVWTLPEFLAVSARLLRRRGVAVAMKGRAALAAAAYHSTKFSGPQPVAYTLAGGIVRVLLVYRFT